MELFDKKYVHFMWEDELEGKRGFFEDSIDDLIYNVNDCTWLGTVTKSDSDAYPFLKEESGINYSFFYYDPNYECKKAYAEGKQIQCRLKRTTDWYESVNPDWSDDVEYRIKPEELEPKSRRMTNRELSEWLGKGNGQVKVGDEIHTWFDYELGSDDKKADYKIRYWGSDGWIKPTVDIYEKDVKEK